MAGALAALRSNTQTLPQITHGARAIVNAGANIVIGNVVTQTDIHGQEIEEIERECVIDNESYLHFVWMSIQLGIILIQLLFWL